MTTPDLDWDALRTAAREAMTHAYAPYSNFPVGVAGLAAVVAAAALVGFLTIDQLPDGIVSFTPHITTLLVLSLASQRLRMPKADGLVYRRGEH